MLARLCHGALASPRLSGDMGGLTLAPSKCGRRRLARRRISASKDASNPLDHQRPPVSFSIYHNVQEGDTLTSIAKQYDTSLRTIALANRIDNVDVLEAGQVLLVPVHPKVFQKVTALVMDLSDEEIENKAHEPSVQISEPSVVETVEVLTPVPHTKPSFWPLVKVTAPLVFLAPVVVFCCRYLLDAARKQITLEVSKTQAQRDAWDAQHRPKVKRWQGILEGDRELDATPSSDSNSTEAASIPENDEERKKREEDELRESYAELEATYMKFLADSGLAKTGYWRGGIPSSTHDGDFG